ncbi:MAG: DUF6240 domain-containing protein, partial [Lachnospiraceae bacterium]|nr:DUF6240 domain-containing protein [Lachnospiraceae bacterium]
MKIKFEQYEANNMVKNSSAEAFDKANGQINRKNDRGIINVQLGSSDDYAAYGLINNKKSEKKTLAEEIENAANYDAETASRFMAVMSNTMSEKDFNKMMEEGYDPSKMDPGEAITNLDRIKITLAQSGTVISGFNDNIDASMAADVTGSHTMANELSHLAASPENRAMEKSVSENAENLIPQLTKDEINKETEEAFEKADLPLTDANLSAVKAALEKAGNITELNDKSMLYMINNELEPTIENVYEAQYASASGQYKAANGYFSADGSSYMVSKADNNDFSQIMGQIDEVIESAGFEVDNESRDDAKWLLENAAPLTKESFRLLEDLKSMEIPPNDINVLNEITDAISNGNEASDAYLISGYRKIKNARILEEVRLSMTHEANAALAESDFSIDTEELTKKVDLLKEKEDNFYKLIFNGESTGSANINDDIDFLRNTLEKVDEIKEMPAEILARFSSAEEFTLQDIYDVGNPLKQRYDDAMQTYEAVGTEVRTDLGDNIQDAFRNVDDILNDLGYENSFDNERAVRILAYNNMEITPSNIENVRYVDSQVRSLIDKMNPATTIRLIKERINPMEVDITALNAIADSFSDEENGNAEGYAKFLVRLEHNNEITDEEANSYIGIYRLFDKIEKSDGAIIGSLLSSGKDLTLKNLLTESRNRKKYGKIDESINDDHIMTEMQANSENMKIDAQIETAFQDDYMRHSAREALRKMMPESLKNADINENSTFEE